MKTQGFIILSLSQLKSFGKSSDKSGSRCPFAPSFIAILFSLLPTHITWATPPDQKLFKAMSQVTVNRDREPGSGGVRLDPSQTDIRSAFEGPDGREIIVSVWSPRLHPFNTPPKFKNSRPCLDGQYFESTIGIADFTKTHILRTLKTEASSQKEKKADVKFLHAFEWSDTTTQMIALTPPTEEPQKSVSMGTVAMDLKSGNCKYTPEPLSKDDNPRLYFLKHLEIAKKANATDLVFPKTNCQNLIFL